MGCRHAGTVARPVAYTHDIARIARADGVELIAKAC